MKNIIFTSDSTEYMTSSDRYVALVPSVQNENELFGELAKVLCFPDYFGKNWSALDELYRDFYWIEKTDIIIVHESLAKLATEDLVIYLRIVQTCIDSWKEDEEHNMLFVFNEHDKDRILSLLKISTLVSTKRINEYVSEGAYMARVSTIKNKTNLFAKVAESLCFPSSFDFSWDSLRALYCDLNWIKERDVVIVHEDISQLSESDLRAYLNIMYGTIHYWKSDSRHDIQFVYNTTDMDRVITMKWIK